MMKELEDRQQIRSYFNFKNQSFQRMVWGGVYPKFWLANKKLNGNYPEMFFPLRHTMELNNFCAAAINVFRITYYFIVFLLTFIMFLLVYNHC